MERARSLDEEIGRHAVKSDNPYDWCTWNPNLEILQERPLFQRLRDDLMHQGGRYALVGGHGMGKSVLLKQLSDSFDEEEWVLAVRFPKRPSAYSVQTCLRNIARELDVEYRDGDEARHIIKRWADSDDRYLVLLYDNIDHYVNDDETAKDLLGELTVAHQEYAEQLRIVIAGGLGVYKLREELGSPYMSRAITRTMEPLSTEEVKNLAAPFSKRKQALDDEVLQTIYAFSGGNPALVTYVLQQCWDDEMPVKPERIVAIARQFRREGDAFVHSVYQGLGIHEPNGSDAYRVWRYIKNAEGTFSRDDLRKQVGSESSAPIQREITLKNSLELLEASGLIRIQGTVKDDPLDAEAIPSILEPMEVDGQPLHDTQVDQLHHDLLGVLRSIHRLRLSFTKAKKQLPHEPVFSGILGVYFEGIGWEAVILESQEGPGYADVKLTHSRFRDQPPALLELKRWKNPKIATVHQQLVSYRGKGEDDEQCMGVVVIASEDMDGSEWREKYRQKCLPDEDFKVEDLDVTPPLPKGFIARMKKGDFAGITVRHYLLNLRRR